MMKRIAAWVLGLAVVAVVVAIAAGAFSGGTVRSSDATGTTGKADGGKTQTPPRSRGRAGRSRARAPASPSPRSATRCSATRPELPSDRLLPRPREGRSCSGDVVFGNLEGTLTDVSDSPKCGGAPSGDCLRLPHAAELRARPRRRRLHGDERRQQPLLRLRPGGPGTDDRRAAQGRDRPGRPARRDHRGQGGRGEGRLPRLRPLLDHRLAARPAAPPGR